MKKVNILIPMKGHSERIPNKNLKLFLGKPLYHYVLKEVLKSMYVRTIHVNTDSKLIADDIKSNFKDVNCIMRPLNLVGDFVSMNKIIEFDLSQIEGEIFFQTHSTNPLLKKETIDKAIEKYFERIENNKYDSLFSVTRFQTRFYWKTGEPVNHNPNELIRTQDLPIMYEENSNFYIFSRDSFNANEKKRIGKRPFLFEMDKIEATDIDKPEDFIIAEKLYS